MSEFSRAHELKARLGERIQAYEHLHGCDKSLASFSFDSPSAVVSAVESCPAYNWPESAYLLLKGMYWVAAEPAPAAEGGWWSEVGLLMYFLDVRHEDEPGEYGSWALEHGEASAMKWRQQSEELGARWVSEVETWPSEDWILIRDWLTLMSESPFVKEWYSFELNAALSFWSEDTRPG